MADVTGSFGQEDVVLNNAATEATLKQLLSAMQVVAAKAKSEFKNHAEFEKAMGNLAGTTQNQVKAGKKFNDATLRSYKAKEKETDATEDQIKAYDESIKKITTFQGRMEKASGAIVGLINKVSSAADAVRGMDGSIGSAVGALGQIPMGVGDVIKGIFGPVAGAVDQTHAAFLEAGSVGANFGGNMAGMLKASSEAGLSLSEFGGIIKGNSEALMLLGGSTAEGAKRLAKLGKDIRNTPLAADLARLGFSTADINEGFADYSKMLARNGRLQGKTDAELIQGTHSYLKNLDAVSKLTGKSKESLQAEEDARQADAQYRIMMSKLDEDGQKNMKALMDSIPKQHQAGLKEILATGTATTDAGIEVMAYLKQSGSSAQELFNQMQNNGTLSTEQMNNFTTQYKKEADEFAKSPLAETLGKFDPAANDFVIGVLNVAARTKTLEETLAQNEKDLKDITIKEIPDLIDPATVQNFKQNINQKSIEMTTALASIDLTKLEEVFNTAADMAVEYLPKAVELAADNFEVVAGTVLALNSAALLATVALKSMSLAAGASMMGGPTKAGKAAVGGGAGAMGKGAVAKGVARKFAPLAVLMAGVQAYSGVSEANERAEAGEITGNEATVEKSEAIGEAVGGGGGALAGAAAGAALGSVVPVVGTAIGGLIGGAIGYWAGSKGGELAGEAIGDAIAGEDTIKDLEAQITEQQARIKRSESGENEYLGFESSGIKKSKAKIEQLKRDLELVKKRTAEAQKEAEGAAAEEENNIATEAEAGDSSSTSTTATDAQKKLEAEKEKEKNDAIKKQEELKKKTDEEKKAKEDELSSLTETKKTPEEMMLALNTNIEELVSLTRLSNSLSQKHIGVAQGMSNDAYTVG
tara:strand:- start:834 stop:3446 length:2613 start_codon:yes stop_codon:yes gene_type:complete